MNELIQTFKHMPNLTFTIVVGILLLLMGWAFYHMVKSSKLAHIILDTPTSKIRSAAQGYVEIKGVIESLSEPLLAPLTKKPCCWYSYIIEEERIRYDAKGNRQETWEVIDHHDSSHFFYVKDNTGVLSVYPLGAEVSSLVKERWYDSTLRPASGLLGESVFSRLVNTLTGTRYRFTERRLEPGQSLVALGFFHTCRGDETPFSLEWVKANRDNVLREKKKKLSGHKLLGNLVDTLTLQSAKGLDAPKKEWQEVLNKNRSSQGEVAQQCNVLHKKDRPMILSNFSEKILVRKYKMGIMLGALGFIVSLVALTYVIFVRMH